MSLLYLRLFQLSPLLSSGPLYGPKARVTVLWPRMGHAHSHGYCLCLTWLPPTSYTAAQLSVPGSAKQGSFHPCPGTLLSLKWPRP
jgi:hypothetical protein